MRWLTVCICFTLIFAIGFTIVFVHSGYLNKVLAKLGLKSKDIEIDWTASGWDRCLKYLRIDSDIVMFGDSITSGCDFSKYFPDVTICNLGIPGDSLLGMKERAYMLGTVKPEKVFILGGINGITNITTIGWFILL